MLFWRKRPAFLVIVAVLSTAAPARAQDGAQAAAPAPSPAPEPSKPWGPRLEYSGAPGCPTEESFRDKVAMFFRGVDPFDPNARKVLRVTLKKIAGGYRASVQYTPPQGDPWPAEEMTGAPCAVVVSDAARLASIRGMDKPKAPPPEPPAPPPPAEPAPAPSQPPPAPVASTPPRVAPASIAPLRSTSPPTPPRPPMDLTVALHTAFVLTAGYSDNVGPALQIGASARHDWETWGLSLGLEVRGVFPSTATAREVLDLQPGATPFQPQPFDLSQLSAQLVPCAHFLKYVVGCGVLQGGVHMTEGAGSFQGSPGWGLGPRLGFELPFAERFALHGFAEALVRGYGVAVPFSDPDQPERGRIRWVQPEVSGFFGLGLSVKFK